MKKKRFNNLYELANLIPWGPGGIGTFIPGNTFMVSKEEMKTYMNLLPDSVAMQGNPTFRGVRLITKNDDE